MPEQAVAFTDSEREFLFQRLELIAGHPLKLQILCDWIMRNRRLGYDEERLADEIGREYSRFFPSFNQRLWRSSKKLFTLSNIGKTCGILKDARELATGKGDDEKSE